MKSKKTAVYFYIFLLILLSICSVALGQSHPELFARQDDSTAKIVEQWTEIAYPGSPALSPIVKLFSNAGYLYAATESGGLFRSADEGASWQASSNGLPSETVTRSFAVIGSVILIGTNRGVYRSVDQGQSWIAANTQLPAIASLVTAGSTLFAGSTGNLFRSTDEGQNWTEFKSGLPDNFGVVSSLAVRRHSRRHCRGFRR